MTLDWTLYPHFTSSKFDSPDLPGSGELMDPLLLSKLELIRLHFAKPIIISSGYRTPAHNQSVNGRPRSEHLLGTAVDIACTSPFDRYKLVQLAFEFSIPRIEWGTPTWLHFGVSSNYPQDVLFLP